MGRDRNVAIVGVADFPLQQGRVPEGWSVLKVQAACAKEALDEAGLSLADVDGLFVAGAWPGRANLHPTLALSEYLGIQPSYLDGTNLGGASFEAHVGHAVAAIEAGLCSVALVSYGSTQRSTGARRQRARNPEPHLADQFILPYGLPDPLGAYALAASRHMAVYGTTSEQLAEVAVAARGWAGLNPMARHREPITIRDVLQSDLIAWPLHKLDCCLVTDGGGAVVLASQEKVGSVRSQPVWVIGHGESTSHLHIDQMPDLAFMSGAADAGERAFDMAGVTPEEIDVVEIYDSFTITVLMSLEALGFCDKGEGGAFVSGGRIAPGGAFPLNTSGGGLSYAHPGMFGIFLLIETARQLRGECGARQVEGARLALAHGTGITLSSAATVVLAAD